MLAFSHFYRLNTLILGQFPCFSGIFHIKPLDRPIFLNYPENLHRCTGELAGILAGLATWWAVHPPAGVAAVLLVPLIADGLLQLCTPYESGNLRRLATGLLFGYGLTVLLLTSLGWAYQWGFGFGKTLLDP